MFTDQLRIEIESSDLPSIDVDHPVTEEELVNQVAARLGLSRPSA